MNKLFFIFLIIFLLLSYIFYFVRIENIYESNKIINIKKGESIKNISNLIIDNSNIIEKRIYQIYLIIWDEYFDKINFGEFKINKNSNLFEITKIISKPSNVYYDLLIVDGWQKFQLNRIIKENFNKDVFFNYNEILADTYKYQHHNTFEDIYKFMVLTKENFFKKYMDNNLLSQYTHDQIMTISSLVEKEGIDEDDKRIISSVIFNRLKKNMKLQIDASTIFAITKGEYKLERKLTLKDLKINDKYNTYYINGLPPAPICFVGRKTIEIVLENYITDYLFYFYDESLKKHIYSKTFQEHYLKLQKYRKKNE